MPSLTLDPATLEALAPYGFSPHLLEDFSARLQATGPVSSLAVQGRLEPLGPGDGTALPPRGTADFSTLERRGLEALERGEVGVVVLAGGMATRFGGVVKALVPVLEGKSFLELKLADADAVGRAVGRPVPVYAMTSHATHRALTAAFPPGRCTFFPQAVSLRLTPQGELWREDGAPSPYATGHGDLTFALRDHGLLAAFQRGGGRHLLVSNVDNLGAVLEPAVLGAHLASGRPLTAEVVRKRPGDRGGAPARLDGRAEIIEGFRFPPGFDQDALPLFNTNTFVLDAAAVDRDFPLTYFRVEKAVGGRTAVQFERLVGQLTAFLPSHFLTVPRDGPDGRFQPAKDPPELEARLPDIRRILAARGLCAP